MNTSESIEIGCGDQTRKVTQQINVITWHFKWLLWPTSSQEGRKRDFWVIFIIYRTAQRMWREL